MSIKRTIKDVKLYEENEKYYLDVRFEEEDQYKVVEFHIPKVRFPIEFADLNYESYDCPYMTCQTMLTLPDRDLVCETGTAEFFSGQKGTETYYKTRVVTNASVASKVIREKEIEMTMEELEKRLGHKIKIINKH